MRLSHSPAGLVAGLLILAAAGAAPAFAAGSTSAFDGGSVSAGHKLFLQHCAVCHKADASGGIQLGDTKSADLRAPELETVYHESNASLADAIMNGKDEDGEPLDTKMPHWNGRLSTSQVADIIAFLKTEMKK